MTGLAETAALTKALVCAVMALAPAGAQYQDTHYAAVTIANPTGATLHYQFRWGETGAWQSFSLPPGSRRLHTWEYDYANQNRSPVPYLRYDWIGGNAQFDEKVHRLEAYAVPARQFEGSKQYYFRYAGVRYLYLYSAN
jgi:hypothetical protein